MHAQQTSTDHPARKLRFNEHEAAAYLGFPPGTLRGWRHQRRGPAWLKLLGAVRYDRDDLDKFIAASRVESQP